MRFFGRKRAVSAASASPRSRARAGSGMRPATLAGAVALSLALAPSALAAHAHAHAASVPGALARLARSGAVSAAVYRHDRGAYASAVRSLSRLRGTRHVELGAVIANMRAMAAAGELTASRLPALILTLERNRRWWTTRPLLASGERVTFPPSKIVWEYYAGQGIQIQWLGTFGAANGYYLSGHEDANLRKLLDEALPLATRRAGGIAWEYMFRFDGGRPPWTSALSQGTALQVLARAWSRFGDPAYLTAAQQALGIFRAAPSTGVRVRTRAGAHYAEYSYAPHDRILNGFIQALVGLYDYTALTKDPLGLELFQAGDAEARAEVPHYDTGAWSRYDQFGESNLNYHELLTEFLKHLCERTRKGEPLVTAPPAPPPGATGAPAAPAATPGAAGGTSASSAVTRGGPGGSPPIAGDQIYCTTAQRFSADLHTPPAIALLTRSLHTSVRAGVQMSLSKISTVTLTVRRGGHVVWNNRATVSAGKPRLLWLTPSARGSYSVTLTASDLAGNFATARGTITLAGR
jgi:D-glucuronyl C5-epimerase C-terminus